MFYEKEIVNEIKAKVDIVDIISQNVRLKQASSSQYKGLCPFHNEKTPSFFVNSLTQSFVCFGCGERGDVLHYVCKYENYTFVEAVQYLAEKANVTLPESSASPRISYGEKMQKRNHRQLLLDIHKAACGYYFKQLRLPEGAKGMQYFQERQLDRKTMVHFGLGYAPADGKGIVKALRDEGFTDQEIRESGIVKFSEQWGLKDRFAGRVMFPIRDINEKVIGFGGRILDAKDKKIAKYLNSAESEIFDKSKNLYGLDYARKSRKNQLILCEGYMDVIALHQAGFDQAVASLGTALTESQANIIKRFSKEVLLAYDSDGAGVKAALRGIEILRAHQLVVKVIDLTPYKDPDELIKNLGKDEFQKRMDIAENGFLFEIRILYRDYHMDDPTEKTNFYTEIAKKLCQFEEEMERENYLEAVAKVYDIAPEQLRKLVQRLAQQNNGYGMRQPPRSGMQKKDAPETALHRSQKLLLNWLVAEPRLYFKMKEYIGVKDFTEPVFQKLASYIFSAIEAGDFQPVKIMTEFEDPEEHKMVAEVFGNELEGLEGKQDKEIAFRDLVVAVKQSSYEANVARLGSDLTAMQEVIEGKKALEKLKSMKISL